MFDWVINTQLEFLKLFLKFPIMKLPEVQMEKEHNISSYFP